MGRVLPAPRASARVAQHQHRPLRAATLHRGAPLPAEASGTDGARAVCRLEADAAPQGRLGRRHAHDRAHLRLSAACRRGRVDPVPPLRRGVLACGDACGARGRRHGGTQASAAVDRHRHRRVPAADRARSAVGAACRDALR
eukprot:4047124-Pleurochrysis_carterae.AAC.1